MIVTNFFSNESFAKLNVNCLVSLTGSRDGVVVIALASHLHGPGLGHKWVKWVVGSLLCSERFFSGFSGFLSPQKSA